MFSNGVYKNIIKIGLHYKQIIQFLSVAEHLLAYLTILQYYGSSSYIVWIFILFYLETILVDISSPYMSWHINSKFVCHLQICKIKEYIIRTTIRIAYCTLHSFTNCIIYKIITPIKKPNKYTSYVFILIN